jgi:hypothetical protein
MTDWTFERRTTARRLSPRPVRPRRRAARRSLTGGPGPYLDLAALVAAAAAPAVLLAWLLPAPLVLPALSIVSFAIAIGAALYAICSGADRHADGITAWNVAGLFAIVWVAAGAFSEPENVLQLFGHVKMAP